jgi:hypothetical protein
MALKKCDTSLIGSAPFISFIGTLLTSDGLPAVGKNCSMAIINDVAAQINASTIYILSDALPTLPSNPETIAVAVVHVAVVTTGSLEISASFLDTVGARMIDGLLNNNVPMCFLPHGTVTVDNDGAITDLQLSHISIVPMVDAF